MVNFYSTADTVSEDVRKQGRLAKASASGVHSRYCPKGNRVAKTTASGRFEKLEEETGVRSRTEMHSEKSESILEDGDFRPLVFVTGAEALKDGPPTAPRKNQKLPVARVFRLDRKVSRRGRWVLTHVYAD